MKLTPGMQQKMMGSKNMTGEKGESSIEKPVGNSKYLFLFLFILFCIGKAL